MSNTTLPSNPTTTPVSEDPRPAIHAQGIGKTYRMWASPSARLSVPMLLRTASVMARIAPPLAARCLSAAARRVHTHVALQDVDLTLLPGQALGIIGLNGSGKSTLLQIVAGVLPPTAGTVEVHGRVAALLELGSGFNPELSGRENVRINAAILGLSQTQIEQRMGSIIAFADIGDYIDEPVKTYSSGMALRLAFAVQVHIEPDVLIVDEALAVGDATFQAKAMAKIEEILARGTTLLFVGHDLNSIRAFCHRAMLLEGGRVVDAGLPDDVIVNYMQRNQARILAERQSRLSGVPLERLTDGYGVADACVVACQLNGDRHASLRFGEQVTLTLHVRLRPELEYPALTVDIVDTKGLQLSGKRIALPQVQAVSEQQVTLRFPARLQKGVYRLRLRVIDAPSLENTTILSRQDGHLSFEVIDDSRAEFTGMFPLGMDVQVAP